MFKFHIFNRFAVSSLFTCTLLCVHTSSFCYWELLDSSADGVNHAGDLLKTNGDVSIKTVHVTCF